MVEKNASNKKHQSYEGLGIAMGFGFGSILGSLPLAGNIGWMLGGSFGVALGFVNGINVGCLGFVPMNSLLGMLIGWFTGMAIGWAVGLLLPLQGFIALGGWIGLAVGMVIGTCLDVRKQRAMR